MSLFRVLTKGLRIGGGILVCDNKILLKAMEVLSKDMIERWILPHLSKGKRGPAPGVKLVDVVE